MARKVAEAAVAKAMRRQRTEVDGMIICAGDFFTGEVAAMLRFVADSRPGLRIGSYALLFAGSMSVDHL